ncbi:MAG: leucine--tRNA ligase [Dehalococcoidia bacterium]|nr:leucine--tRNA ligase [Dehalococcoidia bacterium]
MTDEKFDYTPNEIENKWQARWEKDNLYQISDQVLNKENRYHLTMFPYTSGDLHIGHWYAMAPSDAIARYYTMKGKNVLFPMGFDAFGLPAENAAIKGKTHPKDWTDSNIERMRKQLKKMGAMFDWSREVNTSSKDYYKWTQWWFLQLYKNNLAYRGKALVNWDPVDETTLANEQVIDGRSDRSGALVEQREMEQWFFRITNYAEELLENDHIEWPVSVKAMQKNWIGKSEGAEINFSIEEQNGKKINEKINVFTTRPDTLYGVTFMVLAPEHPLVEKITTDEYKQNILKYQSKAKLKSEIERQSIVKDKTGIFTGAYCKHPLSHKKIPIWIADYVSPTYGTGAVMGVPAHDERDFQFANQFSLPIIQVIAQDESERTDKLESAYTGEGVLINSNEFNGINFQEAKNKIIDLIKTKEIGNSKIQYRMRDWLISRQRYWGAPIPVVYCQDNDCGIVAVPEDELPVMLPYDVEFLPTGQSPLSLSDEFVQTKCPNCNGPAKRETDTMDTFMCSSWYYMRYADPNNDMASVSISAEKSWLPVDQYTGGAEHAVLHLLYSRFFYKAARDMGILKDDEPFKKYYSQGQILGTDGQRMSKSRGNVVAPDNQVEKWGADAFRSYLMFLGPWDQGGPYDLSGVVGTHRWLNRLWKLVINKPQISNIETQSDSIRKNVHTTLKKVTFDIENFRFNTMIASLMELTNEMLLIKKISQEDVAIWNDAIEKLCLMTAPICPHIAEELWEFTNHKYSIHKTQWPEFIEEYTTTATREIPIQINGKLRTSIIIDSGADKEEVINLAKANQKITNYLENNEIIKIIFIKDRLLNIVIKQKK